ncbi:hypothetical protein G6F57_006621 [Rhizopus arrhizus]|uniref:Calcium-channel protein CCH1 n=1 Tax=Rhizopus oryzae TaxID=64495 RepID=A0A9P6XE26_RHIOR|nr:hypothetical protein G6F23_002944 [Rhizopus arrhizus]KAG1420306.1 hypothetical protein G6F58_004246 [Rhizopus delemar]KAG0761176.1 hypothetical protein G6F24_007759 [Rhizopus arrhizus]KAG0788211.1 hypothetical protein G6F21_007371 [Rhizopus arrhizus]KAG0812664.1 hypothetical protein G6F20_006184 [Rhizopus arrhizus]
MIDSDEEIDIQKATQPVESHGDSQQTFIPRIILTEAPPDEQHSAKESPINSCSQSSQTLSPDQNAHRKSISGSNPSTPLPLTKDLLRRKNKLERLLHRQEKHSNRVSNPLGISYPEDTTIDERVTAGLGITTPNQQEGLRHRRQPSYQSESEKNTQSNSSVNQQHLWQHNRQRSFTTHATDSTNNKSKKADTSVTGTSNKNNNTLPNINSSNERHRYIDQHHNNRYYRQLRQEKILKNNQKSNHYLLELLLNTAKRVVNSRVSESKDISNAERFDFIRDINDTQTPLNNKIAGNSPIYSPLKKPASSPNHSGNNRLSWLSVSTTNTNNEDESNSLYHVLSRDKTSSTPYREAVSPNLFYNQPIPDQILPLNPLQGYSLHLFSPNNWFRRNVWLFIRSSLESFCKIVAYGLITPPCKSSKQSRTWLPFYSFISKRDQHLDKEEGGTSQGGNTSPFAFSRTTTTPSKKNAHRAYLNSFANVLDMISITSYWIDVILMAYGYPYLSLFKALGALRPIRLLSLLPGTAVILKSLELSWDLLLAVSGLIFFFLLLFALLGLMSFQGTFSRRCYYTGDDDALTLVEPAKFCTGYFNGTSIVGPYNIQTGTRDFAARYGYVCNLGQICIEDPANNPQSGFVNYDNIFFSFLSVYTFVSLELWTDLMYQTQDADSTIAALYYCLGVYIISFILTFLLLAVITSAFARVRALSSVSAFTAKKKSYLVLRDTEEVNADEDSENTWMFDHRTDEHRKGVSTLKLRWFLIRLTVSLVPLHSSSSTLGGKVSALGTGESVLNVMIFLVLATALCATMFMQMFGGDYDEILALTDPDNRFDTFWQSFVSLIVVYTSETWTDVLYNAMSSQTGKGSIYAAITLSIYFAFGRYIMTGLYIAVVLENFELSDEYIRHYQIKDYVHRHRFKDLGEAKNTFVLDNDEAPEDYDVIAAEENREAMKEEAAVAKALLIFSDRSRIRHFCKKLVGSSTDGQAEKRNLFNWIIMACVLVSILMVILDEPSTRMIRKDTVRQSTYNTIEISLSIVFIIELGIRIIADGLLLTPNAYLRNYWNQLDICVVLLNTITIFMGTDQAPRGLSTLRSLRILRLIRYFNGIRDIFVALFYSLPLMLDALIFTLLVLIPFAVYGVNIFGGLMWLCNDDSVLSRGECIGEFVSNLSDNDDSPLNVLIPRVWQNPQNNFYSYDNFQSALQHLFSLTSTEGWVDSMFSAMSTPSEPDIQPNFDWNSSTVYHGLFYIIFMIMSQGTIQLFVGVIIEKFKERNGITTLTTAQRQYCDLQRMLANVKPTTKVFRPQSRLRRFCYDLVIDKNGMFNKVMMLIIVLNICTLASEFENEPDWLAKTQDYLYVAFTVVYIIESIIKFLGLGLEKWVRSKWNWFDFSVALIALIFMCLRFGQPDLWTYRIERYCLLLVAFRLGEGIDFLETLYHTIAKSLLSTIQVSAVFMVVMCLFAMVFMEFFGLTKYGIYGTHNSNFRDYGNALLFLVRFTTGEAWNAVLVDYAVQYPNCNASSNYLENDCGSPFWAYILFDAFYIICAHIFMNLFTAVIINNFEYTYETRTRFTSVTKSDLRMFKHAWANLDPRGTGYIRKEDVAKLLRELSGCFRFRIYDDVLGIDNLKRQAGMVQTPLPSTSVSPITYKEKNVQEELSININEINKCLDQMDTEETRRRRFEYNLLVKEIQRTETSKGIPFDQVLTVLSYRLIDISTSLTLDVLIPRLELLEQITQEYHLEKAAGFFLSQIQKRRFIHLLWKKRNEDEVQNLGVTNNSQFDFDPCQIDQQEEYLNPLKEKKKRSPPVPRIVINTVPTVAVDNSSPATTPGAFSNPVSPMSMFSTDVQFNSPNAAGISDSPNLWINTNSQPSSPRTDFDRSPRTIGLSPHSPLLPSLSPATTRQNWLLMDANADMPTEISEGLIESINHSMWAGMLREEDT